MAINAAVISHSDPGAVPGASTTCPFMGPGKFRATEETGICWGRNRIDEGVKGLAFARHGSAVIGPIQ